MKKQVDWWNLFFIFFYIAFVFATYQSIRSVGANPHAISPWDAFLMLLATFRLTRLVVYDNITRFIRDWFEDAREYTFRGTIRTLINCPWCAGLWFAAVVASAYFVAPFSWFFIFILALGGAASLLQVAANAIGWSAEYRKRKTLDKFGP
jgi:hypothetical protein